MSSDARFCSACGAPIIDDDSTLTLSAIEAADNDDDLAAFLDGLPLGVGILVVRHGPNAGSSYRLDEAKTSIGRAPDSGIFLDDITVSRAHVSVTRDSDGYEVADTGSLNGTYVNGRRVDVARVHHGDEVRVGRFRLTFVIHEASDGSAGGVGA